MDSASSSTVTTSNHQSFSMKDNNQGQSPIDGSRSPSPPAPLSENARGGFTEQTENEKPVPTAPGDDSVRNVDAEATEYPKGFKLATVIFALCLSVFCVALDNTVCHHVLWFP